MASATAAFLLALLTCVTLASCGKTASRKATPYPVSGVVVEAQSDLEVRLAGSDCWMATGMGTSLAEGDAMWTGAESSAFVLLKGGARMATSGTTDLRFAGSKEGGRIELSRGVVSLDRVAGSGPSVGTPAAAVTSSGGGSGGAGFVVRVDPGGKTTVEVAAGSARVENGAGRTTVPAGGAAECEPGKPPSVLSAEPASQATAGQTALELPSLVYLQVAPYFSNDATRDAAEDDARDKLSAAPDDAWSHLNLGRALLDAGNHAEARSEFEAALASNPQFSQAYEGLGKLDLLEGKWKEAADSYAGARTADRESIDAVFGLGQAALGMGDLREAEKWYKETLKLDPGGTNPLVGLGIIQMLRQDPATALDDLLEAARNDPENTRAYPVAAMVYSLRGDLGAAEQYSRKALDATPDDGAALEALGVVCIRREKLDAASDAFSSMVDGTDPGVMATGYQDRGAVRQMGGQAARALDDWVKARDLAPDRQAVLIDLGQAHQFLKDYDSAVAVFSQAVSDDPYHWLSHEWLSRAQLARKAYAEAISESGVAIALNPSAWISHLVLGLSLKETGAATQATSELGLARELEPSGQLSDSERFLLGTGTT